MRLDALALASCVYTSITETLGGEYTAEVVCVDEVLADELEQRILEASNRAEGQSMLPHWII